MSHRKAISALVALIALALPAGAAAAPPGAVIFSQATTIEGSTEGGLFAVKRGRLNQLTDNPADAEPAFAPDGRTIAYASGGDLFSVRPDGSGQRRLTGGPQLDSAPRVSADGRFVVFERRAAAEAPADLHRVRVLGGGLRQLTSGAADDREASFSPDGRLVVFVRNTAGPEGGNDDLYSMRPSGADLARLTRSGGVDEFAPRYFRGGIVFSRGESAPGAAAYADIFTMRRDGSRRKPQVRGVGSAYVEDVSRDGRLLLFRRSQGLWVKRIGPKRAHKLADLPDESTTNGVFSSDGRRVAAFVAAEERQSLVAIDVRTRRQSELAAAYDPGAEEGTVLGPVLAWQPTR